MRNRIKFILLLVGLIMITLVGRRTYAAEVINKYCDVLVCGAEPEGIAAAVQASRSGLSTVLIDTRAYPGGLYTSGMLTILDVNFDAAGKFLNGGIFKEFYDDIAYEGAIDYEQTKQYFSKVLKNNNVGTFYNVQDIKPVVAKENEVTSVQFTVGDKIYNIYPKRLIDATQDAQVARKAGVQYWVGREDLGLDQYACSTLCFSVGGVNWSKVQSYLKNDSNAVSGANSRTAWGYAELTKYEPVTSDTKFQLRGLNIAKELDGTCVLNTFQIFDVDVLSEKAKRESYLLAKKELPYVVQYIKENAPGFENCYLDQVADELYIREGVHIIGETTLNINNAFNNDYEATKVAYGGYSIDLQSSSRDGYGGNILGRTTYAIPMGVMIPKGFKNILVVGRSASYDTLIHGSARTVPVGVAMGQAAGALCKVSIQNNQSFRACNNSYALYKQVKAILTRAGVTLNTTTISYQADKKNWSYSYIENLRKQGFIAKQEGRQMSYGCNEKATYRTFSEIAGFMSIYSTLEVNLVGSAIAKSYGLPITPDKAVVIVNKILGTSYTKFEDLYSEGILDYTTYTYTKGQKVLYKSHAYAIMSCIADYLRKENPMVELEDIARCDV